MGLAHAARQYMGVLAVAPPTLQLARRAPSNTIDKAYRKGTLWLDTLAPASYQWSGTTWIDLGGPAQFPITAFVVGPAGDAGYQTVQSAVTAAGTTPALVYVTPGTYTENITFPAGCNITVASLAPDATTITGVHTPPATGFVRFLELTLTSATHLFSSAVAGTAQLTVESCGVSCTNGFTFNLANWTGTLQTFHSVHGGTNNGFVTNSGGAPMFISDSTIGIGTGQTMVTTGVIDLEQTDVLCPYSPTTGSVINSFGNSFERTLTLGGNTTGQFNNCFWSTGATAAITMSSSAAIGIFNSKIESSNNPAIAGAGAGVLTLGGVDFAGNTLTAGTLTLGAVDVFKAGGLQSLAAISAVTSIIAGTTLRATLGAITATNGNFVASTAGTGLLFNSPAAAGAAASPVVVNGRSGQATFTSVSIAANADLTLTITNSAITGATTQVIYSMSGATTGAALSIKSVTNSAGSSAIVVTNGLAANASTADIVMNFMVVN